MLSSLLALISEARIKVVAKELDGSEKTLIRPFLNVRVQLWMRELRRMIAEVSKKPRLRFADDLNEEQLKTHLPLVHCRECGSMGWSGLKRKVSSEIMGAAERLLPCFFQPRSQSGLSFSGGRTARFAGSKGECRKVRVRDQKIGMYYFCTQLPKCYGQSKFRPLPNL